ncbi:MAG: FAD-dependent tricarballylate dehydrogenase TcuA, partial [Proteobacteria bacterium]|nr:FAD-dependent tricarballylate dehydrogenase TcuA [Pseudomonadota bacterium]
MSDPGDSNQAMEADVVVVGAGNAAFCAALAARERGASVLVLERAPKEESGGNTRFTAGAFRVAYDGVADLRALIPDLSEAEIANSDFGSYPEARYFDDMGRLTDYRCDPDLTEILIRRSKATLLWMRDQGVRFHPMFGRQAFKVDGKMKFWGGLAVEAWGGGPGLSEALFGAAKRAGIEVRTGARATALIHGDDGVHGVRARIAGRTREVRARAVVLACGGFEANPEWRARYLGRPWDTARVRGTQFNNGDALRMAMDVGALPYGQWSGNHGTPIAAEAPPFGDRKLTDQTNRLSYPFSVVLNTQGQRFIDEGEDFQLLTYAKTGGAVLRQPGGLAFQIVDDKVVEVLEPRYRTTEPVVAETLEELVAQLPVDREQALQSLAEFNDAVAGGGTFDPGIRDGLTTKGLDPVKSNWAQRLDTP